MVKKERHELYNVPRRFTDPPAGPLFPDIDEVNLLETEAGLAAPVFSRNRTYPKCTTTSIDVLTLNGSTDPEVSWYEEMDHDQLVRQFGVGCKTL